LGADYTINTGDLDNGRFGTTLSVTSTSSATFIANNFEIRGDATNETFTHMDQGIVIDGVNYIHRVLEHPTFDGLTSDRRTIQLTA